MFNRTQVDQARQQAVAADSSVRVITRSLELNERSNSNAFDKIDGAESASPIVGTPLSQTLARRPDLLTDTLGSVMQPTAVAFRSPEILALRGRTPRYVDRCCTREAGMR
jgi:hypothetical protein